MLAKQFSANIPRHQLQAVAMMAERESRTVENPKFPSIWIPEEGPLGLRYVKGIPLMYCFSDL